MATRPSSHTLGASPTGATTSQQRAWRVAAGAHTGQLDVLGRPYLVHVSGVARLAGYRLGALGSIVGLLHDVVEKGDVTLSHLETRGFSADVLVLVDVLTQRPDEPTAAYLERCAADARAAAIKQADLVEKIRAADATPGPMARLHQNEWSDRLRRLEGLVVHAQLRRLASSTRPDHGSL